MIDSLEITNWKTHKKTILNFQKGVNVLIGVMGAGKSSAIDAISFGLFGTFPALNSKRVALSGLITNRPVQESEAEVKLTFTVDNNQYKVTRKIGGTGNSAKLEKNGQHLQAQPSKVTEEIESILKVDYDTFSRVVYAEQNQLDYFLELAKGDRKKQIDHMLGLDLFATAEENTTTLINKIKDIVNTEEEALTRIDISELRKQQKQFNNDKESLQKEQEKMKGEEKKAKEVLEILRKKSDQLKKELSEKKKISDEIVKLQSRINTISEEIKKMESLMIDEAAAKEIVAKLEKEDKEISKNIDELRKKERTKSKEHSEIEINLKNDQKRVVERDKIISEIKNDDESKTKSDLDAANAELQEINAAISSKKGKSAEIKEWIKELNKHISKCPVCEREMPDDLKRTLLDSKSASMQNIEEEIKKAEKMLLGSSLCFYQYP